ncbi:MAG: hypothetical protein IKF19_05610 [Bacilli bacterium]|nr:hypothetical protein [Bacilli bacterium]
MRFEEFYISDKKGRSNCVIRSLCKVLNKEYDDVYDGLCEVANKLNSSSFNDIPVFEKYMEDNDIIKISVSEEIKIKDLKIDNSSYIVFCYDKKDLYHMIPMIDNVIYDKNSDCLDLYVITIYRKN